MIKIIDINKEWFSNKIKEFLTFKDKEFRSI